MMNATYSPEDNKLRLYSSSRLDTETYARVKAAGFIWAAKQGLFVAPAWTPSREDLLIELCGEIGDEDTSLVDRAEERAERFDGYQDNRRRDAESAHAAVAAIADHIPLGQPILVGHHSEKHARKDAERIENGMRRAIKMWDTAQYWKRRAAGALAHAKYKERPDVRARRIKTIEADKRKQERHRDEAKRWIGAWGHLNDPHRGEKLGPDTYAMDGAPCDNALRRKRALFITNYAHVYLPDGDPRGWSVWTALEADKMTPREAQLWCLKSHARTIASARRWIAHFDNRLAYEKAMLDEQGASELIAKKPRPKQLPLCNYKAPEGITVASPFTPTPMHLTQIEMTQAQYAEIHTDYKGTRVVEHSHRVRTALTRDPGGAHYDRTLYTVFLTDSKIHAKPSAVEPQAPALPAPREIRPYQPPERTVYDDMKASLREGIKVLTAPQLFPTPPDVARRLVAVAGVDPGHRVLEPSAGTGAILAELSTTGGPVPIAVEINRELATALRQRYPLVSVRCADFLICNGDLGTFDRIVMNPPFERGSDIRHIEHAMHFLKPGGRLAAVCAAGPRQQDFARAHDMEWIDLPAGTFADAGTNVNTAIVIYNKPTDDPRR